MNESGSRQRGHSRRASRFHIGLGIILLAAAAQGQLFHRDPLTRQEARQMRHNAGRPGKRIQLLLRFAGKRLSELQQLQNRAGTAARQYRRLREYREIIGELDDNLDSLMSGRITSEMAGRPKVRKPLHLVLRVEAGFLRELSAIRMHSSRRQLARYHFALDDCLSRTRGSLRQARAELRRAVRKKMK